MKHLGFIGMGNMASAIAGGLIGKGLMRPEQIFAYAPHQDKLKKNAERYGFFPSASLKDLVEACDTLVMACKPYQIEDVLSQIGPALSGKALLSIAAGWTFDRYKALVPSDTRIQFIMPNTPVMVGEGILLFEAENSLKPDEREEIMAMFRSIGMVMELPSRLMGIGSAVAGCGPAFVDLMLEAYADAAVMYGIPRDKSYEIVSQMILGSARLAQTSGQHPGALKDAVCSPAGTTIKGVASLEENGFRNACIKSIKAIME